MSKSTITSNPDAIEAAKAAGLRYSNLDAPGITRRKSGKGFCYRDAEGKRIDDLDHAADQVARHSARVDQRLDIY